MLEGQSALHFGGSKALLEIQKADGGTGLLTNIQQDASSASRQARDHAFPAQRGFHANTNS